MISTRKITVDKEEITIFETSKGQSWRLVHDGKKVIALFESEGITGTRNALFEGATKADCLAEIAKLGLQDPNEVLIADMAQQLKDAYAQMNQKGERELDFAATLLKEAGVTDLTAITDALSAKRGIPVKTK